ncbi:MAG: hypothetical protein ACTHOO_12625 [Alcanivorax sp.]
MEEWGEEILAVRPVPFRLSWFVAQFVVTLFFPMLLLAAMKPDQAYNIPSLGVLSLVFAPIFVLCVYRLIRDIFMDREKFIFYVFENGISSHSLRWTGHTFIPFKDIKEIRYEYGICDWSACHIIPKRHVKLKDVNYIRYLFMAGINKLRSDVFFIVPVRRALDIDTKLLCSICNEALENYRAKHGA